MVVIEEKEAAKIRDWHRFRYKVYETYTKETCKNNNCVLKPLLIAADSAEEANRIIKKQFNGLEIDEKNWQHKLCDKCGLIENYVGYNEDKLRHFGRALLSCFKRDN